MFIEFEEQEFISALCQGDQRAWRCLVETWLPKIKAATAPYNLSEDDRNEVAQIVLIDLHNSIDKFKAINIDAFLAKKARWRSLDLIRRRARQPEGLLERDISNRDSEREFEEDTSEIELLRDALRALPRSERLVVFLFYYNRCSYSRIAEIMNADYDWVKNTLHRTKGKLKRIVGDRER